MTTDDEPVGSLGSEAAKLLEALQDWAGGAAWGAEHIATGSPACSYCPLCRVISAVRDDPEVRQQISTAVTSVVEVVAGLLSDVGRRPEHQGPEQQDDDRDEKDREAH